ncbi:MAG: hypothetical protein HGB15_00635 [Chlorobaculum sp.]|nr:hypothetical protein [Chlorobaculum sp.]
MLKASRAAFQLSVIAGAVLLAYAATKHGNTSVTISVWKVRLLLMGSLVSALIIFFWLEMPSWDNYEGNIRRIYNLLHDVDDPVLKSGVDKVSTDKL